MTDTTLGPAELRAAILAADDITIQLVATPEWPAVDGHVYVRTFSARQRNRWVTSLRQADGNGTGAPDDIDLDDSNAKLAAMAMCDQAGHTLFTLADVVHLRDKNALALERVVDAAAALNGLGPQAGEDAKKNSAGGTATGDSSTASPGS